VQLNSASSVGGGTGTATQGNWLFVIAGFHQVPALGEPTVAIADDIHSFWRPYAPSSAAGETRTTTWYTPNTARQAQYVYVAPTGMVAGMSVLVVEVAGLGPWDTVAGTDSSYAAAATSLSLALGAPSAASFVLAGVCGDSSSVSQAFTPAGWTALHTVTATNGVDHAADAVLTSAWDTTSSSVSVSGTTSGSADLSGFLIEVLQAGPSPVPARGNPNWPHLIFEAGFGSGFNTPPDQVTWTDLTSRCWSWDETTGIQYQLGDIQATDLNLELDNLDNALASDNAAGPYYPHVVTGTPLRIRAAVGTIAGVTQDRWYVISRNAEEWPQQVNQNYRRYAPATATDIWSTLSASGPTPYRGEVQQDGPQSWWPGDDQLLEGGVLPAQLANAALGNTNPLVIYGASGGVAPGDQYTTSGYDATQDHVVLTGIPPGNPPPSVAIYSVAQQQGWMYGDPVASATTYGTSNPVTANPGSAAWQQTGLLGDTGANAWFMAANDAGFPALSGGMTFGVWFSCGFFGSAAGFTAASNTAYDLAGQPYAVITIAELATASNPVAVLQLDLSGHLNLITYNGGTGTSHGIYSSSDLRSSSFHQVTLTATTTTWAVYVDGGLTAAASGTAAGMTSAWTWLVIGADLGASGGSSLSSNVHGGNVAFSHAEVYPSVLPAWRILAHYCAAATAFGLLPAPQSVALSVVGNRFGGVSYTPDGSEFQGSYGVAAGKVTAYSFSALAASQAGSFTSGPSARATICGLGKINSVVLGNAVWASWTALAPAVGVYTDASAGAETNASTVAGSGDSFTSGYGSGASDGGVCSIASGTGASPPAAPSALGDTVAQRLERILSYGGGYGTGACAARCIDPAALPVQAATDIGGQQVSTNLTSITQSDGGLFYVDNPGNLTYWQKTHLAAQYSSPAWTIGPAAAGASVIPYDLKARFTADPQRVWNAVVLTPFSPDFASLPLISPTAASAVNTSQQQNGAQQLALTGYLQSPAEIQTFANWIFTEFGQPRVRAYDVKIDAATYPAAWGMVLGVNCGDVASVQAWQIGGGGATYTLRVTQVKRRIVFGGQDGDVEGSVTLTLDFEPASYWS
jgi:hypothetical protein